jgi:hypothetical protein
LANCSGALAYSSPEQALLLFGGTSCSGTLLGLTETWPAST